MAKVFLAGRFPYPFNYECYCRYYTAQKDMEEEGHDIFNPCYMLYTDAWNPFVSVIRCIYKLVRADVVFMTNGWEKSNFALFEYILARILRKEIGTYK